MIIRTNVNLSKVSSSKKVEKEETKIIENKNEEIIGQPIVTRARKKKKVQLTEQEFPIIEQEIVAEKEQEEKIEEAEDEILSRWLKEEENII